MIPKFRHYLPAVIPAVLGLFAILMIDDRLSRLLIVLFQLKYYFILYTYDLYAGKRLDGSSKWSGEHSGKKLTLIWTTFTLLFVVIYAVIYAETGIVNSMDSSIPFTQFDCFYFSTVTWTTLGYGDFVPTPASRPYAMMQALTGLMFMSILIANIIHLMRRSGDE